MTDEVPAGFEPYPRTSPFLQATVGPMHLARRDPLWILGVRVSDRHVNARGAAHGGLLSTLADVGLGSAIALEQESAHPTTVALTIDFIGPARLDSWLEVRSRVMRVGRKLAFSAAELWADDAIVARASATFALT